MRLFIGISIGDQARAALTQAAARMERMAAGRYVDEDMYHITLAFLGELEKAQLEPLKSAMDEVAERAAPIRLSLCGADFFGRRESAVLYAGVDGGKALCPIANDLRRALGLRNLPFDPKPFRAHITLARRVHVADDLLAIPIPPAPFTAEGLTLFHSCRVNGALRYLPIWFVRFGAV